MKYKTMNGSLFRSLLDYGIRNLALHCEEVNDLNIFPVPDGDTGTNMVTTLRNGSRAIEQEDGDLSALSKHFAGAVVYGARGNSGVISSQFFRGFSETLSEAGAEADVLCFIRALEHGVLCAYRAVTHPAEGTILTVLREATEHVRAEEGTHESFSALIASFLSHARISLENTPNLLPVLKNAGVVDSGGVGIVYVFEGMYKYLNGEAVSEVKAAALTESAPEVDYSKFNCTSTFSYGYCTEGLLQLTDAKIVSDPFDYEAVKGGLGLLGTSVVTSFDGDKLKFHVHADSPEKILSYLHSFGEFLSLKIENMSVQHSNLRSVLTVAGEKRGGAFAVVAVAPDPKLGALFLEMGVDAVISSANGYAPSTQDFLEAFRATGSERIIVFPNNGNLILAAEQAKALAKELRICVIDCGSVADCYAALAMIDFGEEELDAVADAVAETVSNVRSVSITRAVKDAQYGTVSIEKGDMIAISGADVLAVGETLSEVAIRVTERMMEEAECDTVTLFCGMRCANEDAEAVISYIENNHMYTEADLVETDGELYDLILSFE